MRCAHETSNFYHLSTSALLLPVANKIVIVIVNVPEAKRLQPAAHTLPCGNQPSLVACCLLRH
jgi:hypothetical protein